ncbi:hypothetical protein H1P_310050 [Hyella patelloides LEGE 07179]|uniref:Uncharacterized protein n=1 Tax=Hyella patelloides LEGE 07179 TaxID=945734 RepID=A0A563VUS7_9CYAN|nr:hypothetical protein H1P_310050 [Hyella patelloides LEGE 07179]
MGNEKVGEATSHIIPLDGTNDELLNDEPQQPVISNNDNI